MKNSDLSNTILVWSQLLAAIGLIVGVGLVVYELQQNRLLASATLASGTYELSVAGHQFVGGEDPASSIAKACLSPNDLEPRDYVVLDAYFRQVYIQASRIQGTIEEGGFDYDIAWRIVGHMALIARTDIGRDWLIDILNQLPGSDPKALAIEEVLEELDSGCNIPILVSRFKNETK